MTINFRWVNQEEANEKMRTAQSLEGQEFHQEGRGGTGREGCWPTAGLVEQPAPILLDWSGLRKRKPIYLAGRLNKIIYTKHFINQATPCKRTETRDKGHFMPKTRLGTVPAVFKGTREEWSNQEAQGRVTDAMREEQNRARGARGLLHVQWQELAVCKQRWHRRFAGLKSSGQQREVVREWRAETS